MTAPRTHTIKKIAGKDKPVSAPLFYLLDLLEQKPPGITTGLPVKQLPLKLRLLKRLSPFLLATLFSPALFTYWFVAGDINNWLLCFLFVVTEVNLFYIDIVLWKYFTGKKIFRMWIIEMSLVLITAYFIV